MVLRHHFAVKIVKCFFTKEINKEFMIRFIIFTKPVMGRIWKDSSPHLGMVEADHNLGKRVKLQHWNSLYHITQRKTLYKHKLVAILSAMVI